VVADAQRPVAQRHSTDAAGRTPAARVVQQFETARLIRSGSPATTVGSILLLEQDCLAGPPLARSTWHRDEVEAHVVRTRRACCRARAP